MFFGPLSKIGSELESSSLWFGSFSHGVHLLLCAIARSSLGALAEISLEWVVDPLNPLSLSRLVLVLIGTIARCASESVPESSSLDSVVLFSWVEHPKSLG